MFIKKSLLLSAICLCATQVGSAYHYYAQANGGVGFMNKLDGSSSSNLGLDDVDVRHRMTRRYSPGYRFSGAIGYQMGLLQAQVELGYIRSPINRLYASLDADAATVANLNAATAAVGAGAPFEFGTNVFATNGYGSLNLLLIMGNLLYDFPVGGPDVTPYVGLGAGYGRARQVMKFRGRINGFMAQFTNQTMNRDVFAYQGIAGARYHINETVDVHLDYRFIGTTKISGAVNGHIFHHSFNLGIGAKFDA